MVWEMEFKDLRYVYILIFNDKIRTFTFFLLFFPRFSDFRDDERRPATKPLTIGYNEDSVTVKVRRVLRLR